MKILFASAASIEDIVGDMITMMGAMENLQVLQEQDKVVFDPDELKEVQYFKITIEEVKDVVQN